MHTLVTDTGLEVLSCMKDKVGDWVISDIGTSGWDCGCVIRVCFPQGGELGL